MTDIQEHLIVIRNLRNLHSQEKAVLYTMLSYLAGGDQDIDKEPIQMAIDAGISVSQVKPLCANLMSMGYIVVIGDRAGHYIFELNIPGLWK